MTLASYLSGLAVLGLWTTADHGDPTARIAVFNVFYGIFSSAILTIVREVKRKIGEA